MLELFLYRGQFQLGTADALYSDGRRYRPAILTVRKLRKDFSRIKSVLALGAGIGSIVWTLSYHRFHPRYTLVDIDENILSWTEELWDGNTENIRTICADAELFMDSNTEKHDLLFADVFIGRYVPSFVMSETFLQKCRLNINTGGYFVMNYIINDLAEWEKAQQVLEIVFPGCEVHQLDVNRIIIASV